MRGILLALLALARVTHLLGQEHTVAATLRINADNDKNKSLEFAKIIREDLRRNNDDYAADTGPIGRQVKLLPTRKQPNRGPLTPEPSNSGPPIRPPSIRALPIRPPLYHGTLTRQPPNRRPQPREPRKISIDTRRSVNNTKDQTTNASKIHNATQFRSKNNPAKHYNKMDRVEKLKRLIDKEKSRLRQMGTLPVDDTGTPAGGTTAVQAPVSPVTSPVRPEPRTHHYHTRPYKAALRHYGQPMLPVPNQLDMAPARGANIRLIRNKGRLCIRNMLIQEGPKYDPEGRTLNQGYKTKFPGDAPFHRTHKPDLVLPRCCNCCKKSVLGCQ